MSKKKIWILVTILICLGAIAVLLIPSFFKTEVKIDPVKERRLTMISYLSNPTFTNADFCEQLTHTKAKLEINQLDEHKLYFSIKKEDFNENNTLKRLCIDERKVEFAKVNNTSLELGSYRYNDTAALFFRFPDSLLNVPRKLNIKIDYKPISYTISDKELTNFISNKSVYGGEYYITRNGNELGSLYGMNHGVMVAVKNEPSLKRFVKKLTYNVRTKEQKIQKLLRFVTNRIAYNFNEAHSGGETLKRPNEVLMSKSSDCSGKTILFASFMEQLNVDYRLVYLKGHICVYVKGNFPSTNKYTLTIDDQLFHLAETTCPDFKIGETHLEDGSMFSFIQYVQKVGRPSVVTNITTKKKFEL